MFRSIHRSWIAATFLGIAGSVSPLDASVTISGLVSFSTLDNSALDEDPTAGVFAVTDSLVIDGTIECTDAPPLPGHASGCPVTLVTGGDLLIEAGGAIVTENAHGSGSGGDVSLTAAGDVVLRGPAGSVAGARVSTARTATADPGGTHHGGAIGIEAGGDVVLEDGSTLSAAAAGGAAGRIEIIAAGGVHVDGLIASGPTEALDADPHLGEVLVPASAQQWGGAITVVSTATGGVGIVVGATGVVVSQGDKRDAGEVRLEACGIEVRGLVASLTRTDGAASVTVVSGEDLIVDGTDLDLSPEDPVFQARLGTIRAGGSRGGSLGQRVDLYARTGVQVLGPAAGSTDLFAVSASPGTKPKSSGGSITVLSLEGGLLATGNAFEAGRSLTGDEGGAIDLQAAGDVVLDGAVVAAVGNFGSGSPGAGGDVVVQSYQGDLSWTGGSGDVRPVGGGVPPGRRGSIVLSYCDSVDLTGTAFPTVGAPAPPFPQVFEDCSIAGPSLPPGESLPVCNQPPVAADDDFTTDEDSPVAGDVLADNGHGPDVDPGGDPLTVTAVDGVAADVGNLVVLPSGALLTLNADGTFSYDPNGQFEELAPGDEATDSFEYTVEEPGGLSDSATVTVTITGIDDAPVAVDDGATVAEDAGSTPVDVLANDADVDGGPIGIDSVTQPANGTVVITNGGTGLTYQPHADYCNDGSPLDSFSYTLAPGASTATVTVTVTCVDDDPVAAADAATMTEDSGASAVDVLANDTDVDGGPKSVQAVTQPANGVVAITGGGTGVSYTPDADYCNDGTPTDDFTYTLDGGSSATVSVAVTCVDDPPVAVADAATVNEDSGANAIDVLANDTDVDGGPISVQSVTQPANGTVAITGGGTGVSYTPNPDYCNDGGLTDDFTYTLNGGSSATVSVTVACINDPPVAADDSFDFVGNTELRVDLAAAATPHALETTGSGFGVLDNDADPVENDPLSVTAVTVGACTDNVGPTFDCSDPAVGTVHMESDGRFSFEPAPGDADAAESFQYTLSDGTDSVTATVTLTRAGRVWYVDNDTGTAGVAGTSVDPFDTLAEAEAASGANDHIFVHFGDGASTGQAAGIALKNGQHLLGEHVGLSLPVDLNGNGAPTVLFAAAPGNRPVLADMVAGGPDGVSAVNAIPAEVAGLSLSGNVNAIEWTTTVPFFQSGSFELRDNVISGAGANGVDINLAGTGSLALAFRGNSLAATGIALNVQETGAGTLTITAFDGNSVSGSTGGSGIAMSNVVFDAVPGAPFEAVAGGATAIGSSGDGVGGSGMILSNVSGDLLFTDLDVFADGGTGLGVAGTGPAFLAGGTGLRFRVGAGVGSVEATGGPAVDLSNLTGDLQLATLTSTSSPTTGVSLVGLSDGGGTNATFTAGSGSSITTAPGAAGPAFRVDGGNAKVTYGGTITNSSASARAVSITSWSGDDAGDDLLFSGAIDENGAGILLNGNGGSRAITFSGGLDIDTTTGEGFAATSNTNSLGLNVTGATNDIDSVSATALRVTSTPIGSSGLTFRRVASGNDTAAADPANGIVLSGTGSLGGLTVTGTGGAGTGGTIQRTTGVGVMLTNTAGVNLSHMNVRNSGDDGIRGATVHGLNLTGLSVTSNGNGLGESGIEITELTGSGGMADCTVSGSAEHNVHIANTTGTLSAFTVTNGTFTTTSATTGGDGFLVEHNGSGAMTVSITGSTFTDNKADHFQASSQPGSTGQLDVTFSNNTLTTTAANDPQVIGGGITLSPSGSTDLVFTIDGNSIQQAFDEAINLNLGTGSTASASMVGTVSNNVIGTLGDPDSGSESGTGIAVISNGAGSTTVAVTGNQVYQYANPYGIFLNVKEGTTSMNATVTGNTVASPGSFAINGIRVDAGATSGDSGTLCANLSGNNVAGSGPGADTDIRLRQRFATTIRLPGYAGANNDTTAVNAFVAANNAGADVTSSHNVGGGGGGFVGGAACATP